MTVTYPLGTNVFLSPLLLCHKYLRYNFHLEDTKHSPAIILPALACLRLGAFLHVHVLTQCIFHVLSTEDFSYLKHLQTSKTFKRTVLFFVLVCFGLFWFFVCCLFVCLFSCFLLVMLTFLISIIFVPFIFSSHFSHFLIIFLLVLALKVLFPWVQSKLSFSSLVQLVSQSCLFWLQLQA